MREGGLRRIVVPPGPLQQQGTKSLVWMVGLLEALDEAGGEDDLRLLRFYFLLRVMHANASGAAFHCSVHASVSSLYHTHTITARPRLLPQSLQSCRVRACPRQTWCLTLSC